MTVRIVLLADSEGLATRLTQAVPGIQLRTVEAQNGGELVDRIESTGEFDVLACEFTGRNCEERARLVQMLVERLAPRPVIGLAVQADLALSSAALRVRAREFFVPGVDDERLRIWLSQLQQDGSTVSTDTAAPRGKIVVVVSGHPYEGIAFLTNHLAVALQEQMGHGDRALVLDLATPQGSAAIFLNQNPSYSALDAIAELERVDAKWASQHFGHHGSGIHVLSLPESMLGRPQMDSHRLLRFLDAVAGLYKWTVIAIDGHHPLAMLTRVIERADHSILLTDQSILKTRQSKYLLQALRQSDGCTARMSLVVDNYKQKLGLEPKNMAELFKLPLFGTFQTEGFNRIVAMNAGEPLFTIAPKDPYCSNVRGLAATLCGAPPLMPAEPQPKKRWKFF
jgi:pilus assembly protein CpaE